MSAIERLERANPVPDEDRLLAAPGAMDAFVSSVKERSGIVKKTDKTGAGVEDRPPIEVPTDAVVVEGSRRRFGLVAAAAVVVLVIGAAAAILTLTGDGGTTSLLPHLGRPARSRPLTTSQGRSTSAKAMNRGISSSLRMEPSTARRTQTWCGPAVGR